MLEIIMEIFLYRILGIFIEILFEFDRLIELQKLQ